MIRMISVEIAADGTPNNKDLMYLQIAKERGAQILASSIMTTSDGKTLMLYTVDAPEQKDSRAPITGDHI